MEGGEGGGEEKNGGREEKEEGLVAEEDFADAVAALNDVEAVA